MLGYVGKSYEDEGSDNFKVKVTGFQFQFFPACY